MLEDIRVPPKSDMLIEESYEDLYYRDVIYDHSKLLIQKLICQGWFQHYLSDWMNILLSNASSPLAKT